MENHVVHFGFTAVPFLIVFFLLIKKFRLNALQKITLITLLFFFILHAGPFTQVLAFHHQSQSSTEHHPCCMHQVSTAVALFILIVATVTLLQTIIPVPLTHKPSFAFSYLTRAPPAFI